MRERRVGMAVKPGILMDSGNYAVFQRWWRVHLWDRQW